MEAPGAGLKDTRQTLGRRGEEAAALALEARGYSIRARRYRTRRGEIDLIAEDRDGTLVFVEVKAKSGPGYGDPLEAVGRVKQQRLARAAEAYLATSSDPERPCRFDVVAVRSGVAGDPEIEHIVDAFRLEAYRSRRRSSR